MTLAGWCANLDAHWDEAVAEVGEGTARVWRLYMAGSRLGFERNVVALHQILGVKLGADARSGMPLRPDWERAPSRVAGQEPRATRPRGRGTMTGWRPREPAHATSSCWVRPGRSAPRRAT